MHDESPSHPAGDECRANSEKLLCCNFVMSVHVFGKRDSAAVHQSLQVFQEVSPVTVSIA